MKAWEIVVVCTIVTILILILAFVVRKSSEDPERIKVKPESVVLPEEIPNTQIKVVRRDCSSDPFQVYEYTHDDGSKFLVFADYNTGMFVIELEKK